MNLTPRARFRALMLASIAASFGCDSWSSVLEVETPPADVISLRLEALEPVRVSSTIAMVAEIPAASSEINITFTSTAGLFVESGTKTLTLRSERTGSSATKRAATAFLRVPDDTATAYVRATVKAYYASVTVPVVR
jgi:hypothetical protein